MVPRILDFSAFATPCSAGPFSRRMRLQNTKKGPAGRFPKMPPGISDDPEAQEEPTAAYAASMRASPQRKFEAMLDERKSHS